MLREAGMEPMLCDTPVPYTGQSVRAGVPTMPGDARRDEYIMLPKDLVGRYPMFFVDVDGDSMADAGIMPGDRLRVQVCETAEDGDIVIACVDDECTVKAYLQDEHGRRWLVPRNDRYVPMLLQEDMNVRILGRVVEHIRRAPRVSHSDLVRCISRVQQPAPLVPADRDAQAQAVIEHVAPMVQCKRQWYAVYRPLVDGGLLGQDMYATFVEMVCRSVPDHRFLPSPDGLRRMAVQSFRHPVSRWDATDAPVSGFRFEEYMRIAREAMVVARHADGKRPVRRQGPPY